MFSVVIPLYNKEKSISNTLQSVMDQTFQEFEIIVVNDGSTDQSIEKLKDFKDGRIKVIHKENGGVSSARNLGIKIANFSWISFLDGDDIWRKDHLEVLNEMIQNFPHDKVFVTSFDYSDNRPVFRHSRNKSIFKIENYFREAIRESILWTSVVTIQESCFHDIGYFNERLSRGEDLDLWRRIGRKYSIVKSNEITANYRIEAENRSDSQKYNINNSILSILEFQDINKDEKKYIKDLIRKSFVVFLRRRDLKSIIFLIKRYKFKLL